MSALPIRQPQQEAVPSMEMTVEELCCVLQDSVYPGAKLASIKMLIAVCRASGKDPLMKPYHIVPMSVATGEKDSGGWDIKAMRDVIMPGINNYRVDAARTGQHAGTSEPEFGPDVSATLDGVEITYPAWCRVTVFRQLASGQVVAFPAIERWTENYATKSAKVAAPNTMWKKRPYGQIAKCAEAQALRKGFPEVGNQPTADEMEGKEIDMGTAEQVAAKPVAPAAPLALPDYSEDKFMANLAAWRMQIDGGKKTAEQIIALVSTKGVLSDAQKKQIRGEPATNEQEIPE